MGESSQTTPAVSHRARSVRDPRLLLPLLPALLFLGLQLRTVSYEFVWTDHTEIEQGTLIRPPGELVVAFVEPMHRGLDFRWEGVRQPYYRPLHSITASLVHARVGKRPAAYRTVSIAAGAVAMALFTVLAWMVLGRLGAALFAGLAASLHPAGIEVYVWISGMSQALSALFVLSSLLAGLGALRAARPGHGWACGAASGLALVLAMLSHENGTVTPLLLFALVLGEAARGQGWTARWVRARALLPRAAALLLLHGTLTAAFLGVWRPFVLGGFIPSGGSLLRGSLVTQGLSALASWPRALAWLFLPLHSSTSDRIRIVSSFADSGVWLGLGLTIASALLWLWVLHRGRAGAVLGLAWIWLAYLPSANLIPAAHPWAERYIFLSVFGLALFLADMGTLVLSGVPARRRGAVAALLALGFAFGLGQRSWSRAPDWRSDQALFERDVARDPPYREGRFELAKSLSRQGRYREAKRVLEPVLQPSKEMRTHASFLLQDRAFELDCHLSVELRAPARAVERFRQLEQRGSSAARSPGLRLCAGHALERSGRHAEALELYRRVAESLSGPPMPQLQIAMARTLAAQGRPREAQEWLDAVDPDAVHTPELDRAVRAVRRMIRGSGGARPR
jgi:thioredoxin-like negative regulator of GroEL